MADAVLSGLDVFRSRFNSAPTRGRPMNVLDFENSRGYVHALAYRDATLVTWKYRSPPRTQVDYASAGCAVGAQNRSNASVSTRAIVSAVWFSI